MECIVLSRIVLAGKEGSPAKFIQDVSADPGLPDYWRRSGVAIMRVYEMSLPQGDVVTTYVEAESLATGFSLDQSDNGSVARRLREFLQDGAGLDITKEPTAPQAEQFLEHCELGAARQPGLGFSMPVVPGKTGLLRDLRSQSTGPRQAHWAEFNRGLGAGVHRAFVMETPMGDFAGVYLEAPDPVAASAALGGVTSDFGRYFKATVEEALGMDLGQPLPPIRQLFEMTG